MTEPTIQVSNAVKQYQLKSERVTAVNHVNLLVHPGEFTCIHGASGSGKTTLLNLIAGIDVPDTGRVRVAGIDLELQTENERAKTRLRSIGVVFQSDNLLQELTAGENVILPLLADGLHRARAHSKALQALRTVGLEDFYNRRPNELSGGQRQRVGIARALAGTQAVLLADEPTGALDSANSIGLFEVLREICTDSGSAVVLATHDPLAARFADTVLVMQDGTLSAA